MASSSSGSGNQEQEVEMEPTEVAMTEEQKRRVAIQKAVFKYNRMKTAFRARQNKILESKAACSRTREFWGKIGASYLSVLRLSEAEQHLHELMIEQEAARMGLCSLENEIFKLSGKTIAPGRVILLVQDFL